MSVVTEIVFVTTSRSANERFVAIVEELEELHNKYGTLPCQGPNENGLYVFSLGVDYARPELLAALRNEPWAFHTMLWIGEEVCDGPEVWVNGHQLRESALSHY